MSIHFFLGLASPLLNDAVSGRLETWARCISFEASCLSKPILVLWSVHSTEKCVIGWFGIICGWAWPFPWPIFLFCLFMLFAHFFGFSFKLRKASISLCSSLNIKRLLLWCYTCLLLDFQQLKTEPNRDSWFYLAVLFFVKPFISFICLAASRTSWSCSALAQVSSFFSTPWSIQQYQLICLWIWSWTVCPSRAIHLCVDICQVQALIYEFWLNLRGSFLSSELSSLVVLISYWHIPDPQLFWEDQHRSWWSNSLELPIPYVCLIWCQRLRECSWVSPIDRVTFISFNITIWKMLIFVSILSTKGIFRVFYMI